MVGSEGVPLWGSALAPMADQEIVDAVAADLTLPGTGSVVADLDLPTVGTHGATITWTSSDESVVTADGTVTRPSEQDAVVTLTATITSGDATATSAFDLTVPVLPEPGLVARYPFDGDLAATGGAAAATVTGDRVDSDGGQVSFTEGVHGQAVHLDGASGVRLPDGLISGQDYTVSLWLRPEQLTDFTTAFFGARDDVNWLSLVPSGWDEHRTMLWAGSTTYYDGLTGTQIPTDTWSHLAFTVETGGAVTVYLDGVAVHTGTGFPDVFTTDDGVFALGVNWWDTPFQGDVDDLQVYQGALTADQVATVADGQVADLTSP